MADPAPSSTSRPNGISSIINYFSGGFQRSNRFAVKIGQVEEFWASSVQLPEQSITYYPADVMGPSSPFITVPLKRGYDERLLIDFIVDSDWAVRKYFEKWMDSMFASSINSANRSSIIKTRDNCSLKTIEIYALNDKSGSDNSTNAKIVLYEAYPKLILPSEMSNDTPNTYLSMVVDFNYRYYKLF